MLRIYSQDVSWSTILLMIPFESSRLLAHCQLGLTTHSTATSIAIAPAAATATALASNMLSVGGKVPAPHILP